MGKMSPLTATLGLVLFGTAASLIAKLIYSVHGRNMLGEPNAAFTKPWFQVFGMFAGMSVCILMDLPRRKRAVQDEEAIPLLANGSGSSVAATTNDDAAQASPAGQQQQQQSVWIINIPTLFDLFATACGTTGLLYTTVSVYQMLRGAQLVFSAILSIVFLHRRLSRMNYIGIAVCMVGITLVGLANVWGEDAAYAAGIAKSGGRGGGDRGDVIFGILLILLGQVLQGAQVVVEEHLLQNLEISSVRIVAYEGMFGCLHCLLWVFPIVYMLPGRDHGHLENPLDAFYMFFHSLPIAAVIFTDMALMLFYNVCGMEVTNSLSAVSRVIIETLRTLLVWLCDLILFYFISNGKLGEPWTPYSYLQAAGFCLTCFATFLYNYDHLIADYRSRQKRAIAERDIVDDPSPMIDAASAIGAPVLPAAPKAVEKASSIEDGLLRSKSRPLNVANDEDYIDSDDDDDHDGDQTAGSFMGHAVGSASFGSVLFVGTPGGSKTSSLRFRGSLG
jgi:drug/metabolite transporter (DMT)-like permease